MRSIDYPFTLRILKYKGVLYSVDLRKNARGTLRKISISVLSLEFRK